MIDPLCACLDVPKKHRASAPAPHLVPGPMDVQPLGCRFLATAELIAHAGIENFRSATSERIEAGLPQDAEGFGDWFFENPARQVANFDGGKGLDLELGIERAQALEQVQIPIFA